MSLFTFEGVVVLTYHAILVNSVFGEGTFPVLLCIMVFPIKCGRTRWWSNLDGVEVFEQANDRNTLYSKPMTMYTDKNQWPNALLQV